MSDVPEDDTIWPSQAVRTVNTAQAKALRNQVAESGLRFEAYLPPGLAEWVLDRIENGTFVDPSEAVFAILTTYRDLAPHADLREELLRRSIQAAIADPAPGIPGEEAMARLRARLHAPRPAPAEWIAVPHWAGGRAAVSDPAPCRAGDFTIGQEFWCGDRPYRCTDVGSRVIVAIRLDPVEVAHHQDGVTTTMRLTRAEAETQGLFNGPPYAVAEIVFDEYDLEGCSLSPTQD